MSEWGRPTPREEAAMDALVNMTGGGQRATCPACGDTGLHPYRTDGTNLECRNCGALFERSKP